MTSGTTGSTRVFGQRQVGGGSSSAQYRALILWKGSPRSGRSRHCGKLLRPFGRDHPKHRKCTDMIGRTRRDSPRFYRRVHLVFGVFSLPLFLGGALANAGTVRSMDGPHSVPWAFRVELKRERIVSVRRLEHIGAEEIKSHSAKWLAAMASIDAEIARMITRLSKAPARSNFIGDRQTKSRLSSAWI